MHLFHNRFWQPKNSLTKQYMISGLCMGFSKDGDDFTNRAGTDGYLAAHCQRPRGDHPVAALETVGNPRRVSRNQLGFSTADKAIVGIEKMHGVDDLVL